MSGRLPYVLLTAHAGWYFSFFLALLVANLPSDFISGHPLEERFLGNPWELGVGTSVTGLVIIAGAVGGGAAAALSLVSLLPLSVFHLYMGGRSLAAITLAVFLVGCARALLGSPRPYGFTWKTAGVGAFVSVLAVLAGPSLLTAAAETGLLPKGVSSTIEGQAADPEGLIVAGRRDVFVGLEMVQRRPILGFGSSQTEAEFRAACADALAGYQHQVCGIGAIPSHSHLVGGWIEAGIIGAAFWIFVLGAGYYALCRIALWTAPMTDLVVFQVLLLSWDVVFSPGPVRVDMALKLALIMACMRILSSSDRYRSAARRGRGRAVQAAVHRA